MKSAAMINFAFLLAFGWPMQSDAQNPVEAAVFESPGPPDMALADIVAETDRQISAKIIQKARQDWHEGQSRRAFYRLSKAYWPKSDEVDARMLTRDLSKLLRRPLFASLLAQTARDTGRYDLSLILFAGLYDDVKAQGDETLQAHYAWQQARTLMLTKDYRRALDWMTRIDAPDLLAKNQVLQIQARRKLCAQFHDAAQCAQTRQKLAALKPQELADDAILRPFLLAEQARMASLDNDKQKQYQYLSILWANYPGWQDSLASQDEQDPLKALNELALHAAAGPEGLVRRAENLLQQNHLKAAEQMARKLRSKDKALNCRAQYVIGKSLRNQRRYRSAQQVLTPLVDSCAEQAPKALYLLGRVQRFRGDNAGALTSFEKFVSRFPQHAYTDDVLFFAGDIFTQQGLHDQAHNYYQRVVENFPQGDYADACRWRLAWGQVLSGKRSQAIESLDQIARTFATDPQRKIYQQSVYWRSRLILDAHGKSEVRADAIDDLDALMRSDPTSYYGLQALALLKQVAPQRFKKSLIWMREQAQSLAKAAQKAELPKISNPQISLGRSLLDVGLDDDAAALLTAIDSQNLPMSDVLQLAANLRLAGRDHEAHWLIRKRSGRELLGCPDPSDAALWRAAFPRPYFGQVKNWSTQRQLDPNMVFGLMREESAFEEGVVSWAGAVGLMQLMPSTAVEEAAMDKLKGFHRSWLFKAEINIRLGTSHIGRRLRMFDNNPAFAIAAYNAGPGNVKRWLRHSPERRLDSYIESIPVEQTRNYTKRVLRSWSVYRFLYASQQPELVLKEKI